MFKPLTILPVAPFLGFGRVRKAGRWKGESAPVTMNFWNGANGSRHKLRSIALRDLMFLLTREPELATGRVRPSGGPDWHYEPPSLILRPTRAPLNHSLAESLIG